MPSTSRVLSVWCSRLRAAKAGKRCSARVGLETVQLQSASAAGGGRSAGGPPYEQLINANSRKCVDVLAFSTQDETRVEQYTCNAGTNQQWTLV
ncbi:RICIN domain-containing protein [Streptomyces sp. NPDC002537]